MRALSLCLALIVVALTTAASADDAPVVQTDKGSVRGTMSNGIRTFLGIPFAAPPVGALRFAAPKPAASWTGVRDATQAGPECPQAASSTQDTTEDCLFLNVWAPLNASKAPVLVFIYGGGFTQGNGAAYDGAWLAAAGKIIVVTMNYRNGIFGFYANRALGSATGNYGIEDQQAALHWVQRNIGSFGGEPHNVTLGGESAGAMSTCANIAATNSGGTFVRAIVESGPCAASMPTLEGMVQKHAPIAAQLGCTGSDAEIASCLRSPALTVKKILAVQNALPRGTFSPSVEGPDIPVQPRTYLGRIPLLLGGNSLEAGYTILPNNPPATADAYQAALLKDYGGDAAAIAAQYPFAKYANGGNALSTVETDSAPSPVISLCEDVASWKLTRATSGWPTFAYEFSDPNAYGFTGAPGPVHTSELPYLFQNWNNVAPPAGKGVAPASQALSKTMLAYWTNFVKNGDPNGTGLPIWPPFKLDSDVMQLNPNGIQPGIDVGAEHKCAFWNSLGRSM